jgi:hypothetical protein
MELAVTTPYGYCVKGYRYIFGEGKFELSSAGGELFAIYLEPTHEGQEPFACISLSAGLYLFYLEDMAKHKFLTPVYKEQA